MFFVERYSKRKLPALCQLAMEALGIQRFSLHSHHAAHGSFASGALSSVTAKVCGVQKFPEASLEATSTCPLVRNRVLKVLNKLYLPSSFANIYRVISLHIIAYNTASACRQWKANRKPVPGLKREHDMLHFQERDETCWLMLANVGLWFHKEEALMSSHTSSSP